MTDAFTNTLHQWKLDFTILSTDIAKKNQHVASLLTTVNPNMLLTQLAKNDTNIPLTTILLAVIRCTFSTPAGRRAWINQTDVLPLLTQGCISTDTNVSATCVQVLQGMVTHNHDSHVLQQLKTTDDLATFLHSIVQMLASRNTEVYVGAGHILRHVSTRLSDPVQQTLLVTTIHQSWKQNLESNPTASYRALDMLAKISKKSTYYLNQVVGTGCWEQLDAFMNDNVEDLLLQMSVLETLEITRTFH